MIKIGIIGYSEGNGHPYSYSSIFNGFDKISMLKCPYQTIPKYLSKHDSDEERINSAIVSHIWTQDLKTSKLIADASNIKNIVDEPIMMIGEIDGVIIARDDYESHLSIAKPFIEAGIHVFIDKPIAISINKAIKILELEKFDGQIFSSSSLAYDPRVLDAKKNISKLGEIKYIYGSAPGKWENYAIHLVDSLMMILGDFGISNRTYNKSLNIDSSINIMSGNIENGALIKLACMGGIVSPLRITIVGDKGFFDIDFSDPYNAFKNTLENFVAAISKHKVVRSHEQIIKSISLIEIK